MKIQSIAKWTPLALALAVNMAAAQELVLEEIVVTAQKRAQNVVDVPIAISTFGAGKIEATGSRQLADLAEHIPNLVIDSRSALSSAVAIRGVGSNSRNIGFDGRVGVYIDGVYMGQSPALNQQLVDLERVEVLRGPQGALFGKNTVAGAINLITQKPGDESYAEIGVQAGDYGLRQLTVKGNVAINESSAIKAAVSVLKRDGFANNAFDGADIGNIDTQSVRVQYRLDATDDLTILLSADGMWVDQNSVFNGGIAVTDSFGISQTVAAKDRQANVNVLPRDERKIAGLSADLTYSFDSGFELRSLTSWRSTRAKFQNDVDYSPVDLLSTTFDDEYKQATQELQLISPSGETVEYIVGLYYFAQDARSIRNAYPGSVSPFPGWPTSPVLTDGEVDTKSYAIFSNAEINLSENFRAGVGFRLARETKDVDWTIDGSGSGVFFIGSGRVNDSRSDTDFSPSLSLSYDLSEDVTAYVRYAEGYKSGGYNLDYVTQADLYAGIEFDKEEVKNIELGLKGTLMGGRARFAAAIFRADYDDYQVNQFLDLGNGATSISIRNAAKVETSGMELEVDYKISETLAVSAALGLLSAEFGSFPDGGGPGIDYSSNRLPGAAKRQASLALNYLLPIESMGANLAIDFSINHSGDYFTNAVNVRTATLGDGSEIPYGYVDSYNLLNLRIALVDQTDTWSVALWSKNLTDKEYVTDTGRDFLNTYNTGLGDPRTVGVDLSYRF